MKQWMLFFFLWASLSTVAQKSLKKRFCGEYKGQIGEYKLNTGSQLIDVVSADISIKLRKTDLDFTIGRNEMTIPYTWEKKDRTTLILTFKRTVDESPEILFLYKKTKSIMRVGIFPQPNAQLTKKKKK